MHDYDIACINVDLPPDMRYACSDCIMLRPAHALYFAAYEASKEALGARMDPGRQPLTIAVAGATAAVVNDTCMVPVDVVKQRLQVRTQSCLCTTSLQMHACIQLSGGTIEHHPQCAELPYKSRVQSLCNIAFSHLVNHHLHCQ